MTRLPDWKAADITEIEMLLHDRIEECDHNDALTFIQTEELVRGILDVFARLEDRGFSLVAPDTMKRLECMMKTYGLTKKAIDHLSQLLNSS